MPSKRHASTPHLLFAAALCGGAAPAHATPIPIPVVVVELCVAEQETEQVERTVTHPLQKLLIRLPDVAHMQSVTSHGSAQFEIHYKEGATRNDLKGVEETVEQAGFEREVRILSRSVKLGWPRPDGLFLGTHPCTPARR